MGSFERGILSIGVVFVFPGLEGGEVRGSTVFCHSKYVCIVPESYVQLVGRVCNRKKLSLSYLYKKVVRYSVYLHMKKCCSKTAHRTHINKSIV